MINYLEALQFIQKQGKNLKLEKKTLAISDALGAISYESIYCNQQLPAFNNSAMDGFAVKAADTLSASKEHPLQLNVINTVAAGDKLASELHTTNTTNTACEIMTGAPIADHFDAVVRIEDVKIIAAHNNQTQKISISSPVKQYENLRRIGEDFSREDLLIKKSDIITPEHIMAFAALGVDKILTYKKPVIAILCTGKELIDDPAIQVQPGQIRNSNGPYISSYLSTLGCDIHYFGSITDNVEIFMTSLKKILDIQPDLIISSGAVSAGKWDFIPSTLKDLSAEIFFHKAKIKPGKPILFAKIKNGPYFLGLPGNPISTAVGLRFFVYPLLRAMLDLPEEQPIYAKSISPGNKKPNFRFFLKANIQSDPTGQLQVKILSGQESFKINSFLSANCWASLDEDCTKYNKGDIIKVYSLWPTNAVIS